MKLSFLLTVTVAAGFLSGCSGGEVRLSGDSLADRIRGGWAGQTIGCAYGAPTEFRYFDGIPQDVEIPWTGSEIRYYFDELPGMYDDIYMDLTFLEVLDRCGLSAPADSFALAFANAPYPLWHANQAARRNILDGIMPPLSGHWEHNPHADDIDFQIESDFAGLVCPAMPSLAAGLCDKVGHIMNSGDGWYGGVYISTMYSLAFVYDDVPGLVREAVKAIPEGTRFRRAIEDVLAWYGQDSLAWDDCRIKVDAAYGEDVACPSGVLKPYDIDAVLNSAYVTIGLLYGQGDFGRSIDIATRCGQDSDCNPSSVGGILGAMYGYDSIPDYWKKSLEGLEQRPFAYMDISLEQACSMTLALAQEAARLAGGRVLTDGGISVKRPKVVPVAAEQNFDGLKAVSRVPVGTTLGGSPLTLGFNGQGVIVRYYFRDAQQSGETEVAVNLDGRSTAVTLPSDQRIRRQELFFDFDLSPLWHSIELRKIGDGPDIVVDCLINFDK